MGCNTKSGRDSKKNPIVSLLSGNSQETTDEIETKPITTSFISFDIEYPQYENIDVDLTTMSATLVYSQVLRMIEEPEFFINKVVKMSGPFVPYEGNTEETCYPAIVVKDATQCCSSGIEFLLYGIPLCSMKGGYGYPLYNEEATIVGVFETYIEDDFEYFRLKNAVWLESLPQDNL